MTQQKLLSLACAAALIVTAFSTGVIKTKADNSADLIKEFGKADSYVDFSEYKTSKDVSDATCDNNAGDAVSIVDASSVEGASGTKVAKIYQSGTANRWYRYTYLRVTENGSVNTETRLTMGDMYRMELRYKIDKLCWYGDNGDDGNAINAGFVIGYSNNHATINLSGNNSTTNAIVYYADSDGNPKQTSISDSTFNGSRYMLNSWNNECKLWTTSTTKDSNGWYTATLDFEVPTYGERASDTYIGIANAAYGLANNVKLEMYIDYVKINHLSTVKISDGNDTVTRNIIPGTSMAELAKSEEKYDETESSKATVVETKYYSDESCTESVNVKNGVYGINTTLYKKSDVAVVDTENQAAFCGFDSYKLRTKPDTLDEGTDFKKTACYNNTGYMADRFSITNEDSYTGDMSLKYKYDKSYDGKKWETDANTIYIGNGKDLTVGKTYELSFWYKPAEENVADTVTFKFKSGVSYFYSCEANTSADCKVTELTKQQEWKQVKLVWTCEVDSVQTWQTNLYAGNENYNAPILRITQGNELTALYIDTMVISEVTSNEGASMLNKLDNDGKQAIRFLFSYDTVLGKDNTVKLGSGEYTVKERGILVKSADNDASKLERGTEDARVIKTVKINDFDTCWKYEDATGKYQFSMYIKGLAEDDTRELISRGYVVLADADGVETVFYSEENTTSLAKIAAGQPTA